MNRGLLIRFVASASLGAVIAVGTGVLTAQPQIVSTAGTGPPTSLTGVMGNPVEFQLARADPKPLAPPPASATIQLTSFHAPAASPEPGGQPEPRWWSASTPRVPAITQFDGGPLQNVNCLMASGAMLARLGYGIVTTGSQLRALQDDQEAGTNQTNLQNAIRKGWGIRFLTGALTPLQLRALLYAGAGAVIAGVYGELPLDLRLSKTFTGAHSIYVDAFRPPGPDGPAAYYVMDPLGPTWQGYRGAWWPAEDVERFATAFVGNRIYTTWTFPGGTVPPDHPVLPPSAYPPSGPRPTPVVSPGTSPAASAHASPGVDPSGPPASPGIDPMPSGDLPLGEDPPVGEPPGNEPRFPDFHFESNVFELVKPDVRDCLAQPPPRGCPRGIVGIIDLDGVVDVDPPESPGTVIDFLYASAVAPDTYQVILEPPRGSTADVWFWDTIAGTELRPATVESAVLDGRAVTIATIGLEPGASYSFVATAAGDGVRAVSRVGTVTLGP